jgi:hypothetical protein
MSIQHEAATCVATSTIIYPLTLKVPKLQAHTWIKGYIFINGLEYFFPFIFVGAWLGARIP